MGPKCRQLNCTANKEQRAREGELVRCWDQLATYKIRQTQTGSYSDGNNPDDVLCHQDRGQSSTGNIGCYPPIIQLPSAGSLFRVVLNKTSNVSFENISEANNECRIISSNNS